jgi:hypothetical protein
MPTRCGYDGPEDPQKPTRNAPVTNTESPEDGWNTGELGRTFKQ